MANPRDGMRFEDRDDAREHQFKQVWNEELIDVFADVAKYYDRANRVASLGLWGWFRRGFLSTMELRDGHKVLDVCAGTNAVGIALLQRYPGLEVFALDRSEAMHNVGRRSAERLGLKIESVIGDVHRLPFPDDHFDAVTLQYASRHLRVVDVCKEIKRVLKPGGHMYHSDMLRPGNRVVEELYYAYLRICLTLMAWLFRSGPAAVNCKDYFIEALQLFYSANEFSQLLRQVGFRQISSKTVLSGMVGFHKAVKGTDP
ncbi:MAG: bifunctional demethylmenaquinone methyltransferase/2-methoxy-6-polyprenyl-1,4-benzoquinol methylase UbiE [Gammaproteobacteria bacterium]|nr:MAG: bifunctional demethylmenaquinone methyltransferase/2-methoxy-6-polyprenyl-1,4-benzoquinol methylase UbiE [Gammaproteobacteria bacterium]